MNEPLIRCAHTRTISTAEAMALRRAGNPNTHPPEQLRMLGKIILATGWRAPVTISLRSGRMTKGHGRTEAASLAGFAVVPIDEQEYESDEQELADVMADNAIQSLSELDSELAKALAEQLAAVDFDTELAGLTNEMFAELTAPEAGTSDAEPQMDRAAELNKVWQVQPGDLWRIGEHRLLCGDAESAADVTRVLGGDKPLLMVTDPPYGVDYDANWRNEADRANGKPYGDRAVGRVTNDHRADWSAAWALFPGDVAYSWHPPGATSLVHAKALQDSGLVIRMQIIWAKNQFPIGRGDYHVKHEPCWYCVREGRPSLMVDDRTQHTLWEIDKPHKSETGHSTQKPLECMARPIRNHASELVYDPFLGSGTTMVACENLKRKCRGIEISPDYCAVVLQRMQDAFPGIEIERL